MNEQEPTYSRAVQVYPDAVMMVPNAWADPHIGWQLTWAGEVSKRGRLAAASIISSYEYLLSANITASEATKRLKKLRAVYRSNP